MRRHELKTVPITGRFKAHKTPDPRVDTARTVPPMTLSATHKARLTRTGKALAKAKAERDAAVVAAHRDGASLREIGEAVGLTHAAVKRVLDRAP